MNDVKWDLIKNCEVRNVYQKLPTLYNEYVIELASYKKDSYFPDYHRIKIQSSKLYDDLKNLKEGKAQRCYLSYGMADIDIYKRDKKYIIMNSPNEAYYHEYEISSKEFDKMLDCFKS